MCVFPHIFNFSAAFSEQRRACWRWQRRSPFTRRIAVFSFARKLDYYACSSYLRSAFPRIFSLIRYLEDPSYYVSLHHPPPCLLLSPTLSLFLFLSTSLTQLSRISKCCAVVKTTNSNGKPLVTGCLPLPRAASVILTEETSRGLQKKTLRARKDVRRLLLLVNIDPQKPRTANNAGYNFLAILSEVTLLREEQH